VRLRRANSYWCGRYGQVEVFDHPVVERAVHLELQRAQRVGDALERVLQRVREVVHGIDAPGVAGAVVGSRRMR
jgi:hypothetical protein